MNNETLSQLTNVMTKISQDVSNYMCNLRKTLNNIVNSDGSKQWMACFELYKRKCEVDKMVIDVVCGGYHTVVDTNLYDFLRNFKSNDGNFFVIGEGNILNKCEGFECVALPVSQCMIYEMKREDLNKSSK